MSAVPCNTPAAWNPPQAPQPVLQYTETEQATRQALKDQKPDTARWKLVNGKTVDIAKVHRIHGALRALSVKEIDAATAAIRLGPRTQNVESEADPRPPRDQLYPDATAERQRWLDVLPSCTDDLKRIWRFRECGTDAWVVYDEDEDRYRVQANRCHLRICPHCRLVLQKKHARRIREQVGEIAHHQWQFVTLTMRHTTNALTRQLAQLRTAFRRLRQRKCWKHAVDRGYAVIEIGWNGDAQEWHPHLHIVAKTKFIDWSKLRNDWRAVTNGSDQIDCRWIDDADEAIQYVCKYVGKPPDQSCLNSVDRAKEYYEGLYQGRFLIPFGNHPKIEEKKQDPDDKPTLTRICSLAALVALAAEGWSPAKAIWTQIQDDCNRDTDFQQRLRQSKFLKPGSGVQVEGEDTS